MDDNRQASERKHLRHSRPPTGRDDGGLGKRVKPAGDLPGQGAQRQRRAGSLPQRKRSKKPTVLREVMSFVTTIASVMFFVAALKLFIIDIYAVPTGSMRPTIEIDDRILAERVTTRFSSVEQLDVVTFNDPIREGRVLIKRVIAISGQTVDLIDGRVFVDGQPLDEPYIHGLPSNPLTPHPSQQIEYPFLVPDGCIWVMGDNRTDSLDSRYFGPISEDLVSGRGLMVVWPLKHIGGFGK
jgi:signal peptidase I